MRTIEVVSIITGCIEVVLFSGIIYGWPAYVHVLKEEGYFGENCIITSLATANTSLTNITSVAGMFTTLHSNKMALANVVHSFCEDQEKKLNLAFTLALSVFYMTVYFSGYIFDKFGTWVIRILAGVLLLTGLLLLAISSSVLAILIYPASICIAVAGNLLLISNIQLAYLSVKYRFFIIAIINGLFDCSTVVFALIKYLYDKGVSPQLILKSLCFSTCIIHIRTFFLMPRKRLSPINESTEADMGNRILGHACFVGCSMTDVNEVLNLDESNLNIISHNSNQHTQQSKSFRSCMKSVLFWTNTMQFSALALIDAIFLGTLQAWLENFVVAKELEEFMHVFSILLVTGGLITAIPGLMTDALRNHFEKHNLSKKNASVKALWVTLSCTSTLAFIVSVTKTIPILPLQYFTLSAFIVFRSFLYSGNWGFIATAFPAEYYGKLFGLECFVVGLVQLLQYPLLNLSLSTMQGDFTVANISLAILALATLIHPYAIFRKGTGVNRFHAEYEDAK